MKGGVRSFIVGDRLGKTCQVKTKLWPSPLASTASPFREREKHLRKFVYDFFVSQENMNTSGLDYFASGCSVKPA